ncbi:MAG: sugar ABC transporter substrate-binding protein [Propionibacterium sp.]|nr:sugar ABC transporter substrate-binding protein [Propionibacterium sp.]
MAGAQGRGWWTTRRRGITGVTAIGAVLLGLVAGCSSGTASGSGSAAGSGGKVAITFWDDNGGVRTPAWQKIISDFEKQNPNITVNYVGVGSSSIEQKYNTAIAGGSPPDVGMVSSQYLASLVAQKALVPLDSMYSSSPLNGKIDQAMLKSARTDAPDGKLYLMPLTTTFDTLYYRTDWFKKAGLSAPTTWADFFKDAKTLTNSGANQFGFTLRGGAGGTLQLLDALLYYTAPKSFFDGSGQAVIGSSQAASFVQQMADLYRNGETPQADINNGYQQMVSEFDQGEAAMMQHNLGSYSNHVKALGTSKFAGISMPIGPSGTPVQVFPGDNGPAIFAKSAHQAAAWKFVEFADSATENSYWNQQAQQVPANTDAQSQSWVKQNAAMENTLQRLDAPNTIVIEDPHYLPEFGTIMDVDMAPLWQKVLNGSMTAQAFVTKWAAEFTTAQQNYKSHNGG